MRTQKPNLKKWVIMIYSVASDRHSEEGIKNFFKELNDLGKEIDKLGNRTEVKILLQAYRNWGNDERPAYYARRFELKGNFLTQGSIPPDVVYTNLYTNMGDPNALSDYIIWCKDNHPAAHYMLLLWGHGAQYGMFTGNIDDTKSQYNRLVFPRHFSMTLDQTETKLPINHLQKLRKKRADQFRELQDVTVTYSTEGGSGVPKKDKIQRKIINGWPPSGPDPKYIPPTVIYYFDVNKDNRLTRLSELIPRESIDDSLTIEEVCKSLWDTGQYVKEFGNIEILMIFGCGMQTFELAYELGKCRSLGCKYLIASEELIYWEGYAYKTSFLRLFHDPGMKALDLCRHIVTDAKYKPARPGNPGDGHLDPGGWVISCIDIGKCDRAFSILNNISNKIIKLPANFPTDDQGRSLKRSWTNNYITSLFTSRVRCHHFGEDSFPACYIDIVWFCKNFKHILEVNEYLMTTLAKISPPLYKKHRQFVSELAKAVFFFEESLIVKHPWIGENRSERALWPKVLTDGSKKTKGQVISSTGAHGICIYFPFSDSIEDESEADTLFFESDSDYNLEFVKNKFKKNKKFVKKRDSWNAMVKMYTDRYAQWNYRFVKNGRFVSAEKSTEPIIVI